jgi:hypothetical protein
MNGRDDGEDYGDVLAIDPPTHRAPRIPSLPPLTAAEREELVEVAREVFREHLPTVIDRAIDRVIAEHAAETGQTPAAVWEMIRINLAREAAA